MLVKKEIKKKLLLSVFRILDYFWPKKNHFWAFPCHFIQRDRVVGNMRSVLDFVKEDVGVKKIIFTISGVTNLNIDNYKNTEVVNMFSVKGLLLLLQTKVVLCDNTVFMNFSEGWNYNVIKMNLKRRVIVNLWHGIPLKKIQYLSPTKIGENIPRSMLEKYFYAGLIASSSVDSYAMSVCFYSIDPKNIWITGLPRNDYLVKSVDLLPEDYKVQADRILKIKGDKKLILYAPTYREVVIFGASYYQFSDNEIEKLLNFLKKNNAVLGVRLHYYRNSSELCNIEKFIDNEYIFNLGQAIINEAGIVVRFSDAIITDYSSLFLDAVYVNKPVFSFAYDRMHYEEKQRGLLYHMSMVFPGPILSKFDDILNAIEDEFEKKIQINSNKYKFSKQLFYKYDDANNSQRVVELIKHSIKKCQK